MSSQPHAAWQHVAQFYEDDRHLSAAVAKHLASGLSAGQPAIAIVTPPHRESFAAHLRVAGLDPERLRHDGELSFLDARETLATFMRGGTPDAEDFTRTLGGLIDQAQGEIDRSVQVYDELVDLLWRDGNPQAAIRLEELWNALAKTRAFSLLCGYSMGNFSHETHSAQFQDICGLHAHVVPTERYTERPDEEARLREICLLQQRARSLESEIEHRKVTEQALGQALADHARAEAECERLLAAEQAARAEAERASWHKDEFLGVLSHEIRAPLNAIIGWTQIIHSQPSDTVTVRRSLEVIERNATQQLHVIDDLLDVSRIVTGKMRIRTEVVDLPEVVTDAIETVQPAAAAKDIDLRLERSDTSVTFVTGDRDRLQQVLWNLLSNAIKFTPQGGQVVVSLDRVDSDARIVVRDTGEGISPEFLPHVFDRFRQADTGTERKHGGLGLGLAIARSLVEAHGGSVTAESDGEGLGASFVVRLPVRAASTSAEEPSVAPPLALQNARVLVVGDQADARELFRVVLERAGAVVAIAASVDEALEVLGARPIDVVIGDIGMPDRDGYALIEAIRRHATPQICEIPAIAVTSYAGDQCRARAVDAGYNEYISKPIAPGQLEQIVSEVLRRSASTTAS